MHQLLHQIVHTDLERIYVNHHTLTQYQGLLWLLGGFGGATWIMARARDRVFTGYVASCSEPAAPRSHRNAILALQHVEVMSVDQRHQTPQVLSIGQKGRSPIHEPMRSSAMLEKALLLQPRAPFSGLLTR